jgi:transcriptional regulator with XRE-family HTH domain
VLVECWRIGSAKHPGVPDLARLDVGQRELNAAIGARIRARRKAKGWSQAAVVARTGGRANRLSSIENGHSAPNVSELLRFRDALGMSLDELVTGHRPDIILREPGLVQGLQRLGRVAGSKGLQALGRLMEALADLFEEERTRNTGGDAADA